MLKKELKTWLKEFNEVKVPLLIEAGFKANPINAREGLANLTKALVKHSQVLPQVVDDYIFADEYDVPVRIYNPSKNEKLPVMIFIHGGGHMAGSVTVYDPICRRLANETKHIVVSVEYRLSPENPYPSGKIDCINAIKGVFDTLTNRKIQYIKKLSVVGDSGGGANTAFAISELQDYANVKIDKQVLIYPSLDYTMNTISMEENAKGYLLEKSKIEWYFNHYFQNNEDRKEVSPLYKKVSNKIPDTLIFTAEFDPLRDEGVAYGNLLQKKGIKMEHYNLKNMTHTYLCLEEICKEECDFTYNKINDFVNN